MPENILWRSVPLILIVSMIVAGCSNLAGDVEIVATLPPQSTGLPLQLPDNPPDIGSGAVLFQQHCTECHGINGAGDGELVGTGEVPRMGSFQDATHVRQQSVEFYYDIITNGNLINLMPPWSDTLSLQERWDVAMYVYTLHYSEELIAQGEALVDSPSTEIQSDSDADLAIATGLTGEEAYAAVAYERMQSVQTTSAESTPEAQIMLESANFSGTVIQGSPGASLPDNITLQLQYGDFAGTTGVVNGTVDASGQFAFNDVPVLADSNYFAVVFYNELAFVSEPITTGNLQAENTLDITLYETTSAPNIVTMTNMEIVLDYLTVPDLGEGILTRQLNVYNNPTDYIFHLAPAGQNVRISLLMTLPIGSIILNADEQTALIPAQDQYSIIDTRPVYPGEHLIDANYFLPYDNQAQTVDIVVNNNFEGEINIIVVDPELQITGDNLNYTEDINLGTDDEPAMARVYSGTISLEPGDSLVFDIEGTVIMDSAQDTAIISQNQVLPILIAVGIVTILIIGGLVFFMRGNSNNPQREIDRIIEDIAQLEQSHDAGNINHDVFQQKRADLKKRLEELMNTTESQDT